MHGHLLHGTVKIFCIYNDALIKVKNWLNFNF